MNAKSASLVFGERHNHNHNLRLMTADKTQHVYMRIIKRGYLTTFRLHSWTIACW